MITGRTDRQTDRQSATQYAAPPREEGRIIRFIGIWQPKAGLQYMYIHTNNHAIKYESMSLVVGEAIAYKRVFKPISPCKITGNLFADLSRSISD